MPRPGITQHEFGHLPSGEVVTAVSLSNANEMKIGLLSYGAAIQSVIVPDRDGTMAEVTYGHDNLAAYLAHPQYAGATVGRVANRIAGARFSLDGKAYSIAANDGTNALHGGARGFDKANWRIESVGERLVTFAHASADADQGFPGKLEVTATYALDDDNRLSVEYRATTDAPTIVNLSNHAYWNLAGVDSGRSAMGHRLSIDSAAYLPVDATLIPTGERRRVEGSAFDFRRPAIIGERVRDGSEEHLRPGRGFDHNWVLGDCPAENTRPIARLDDSLSGRSMVLDTNQPGLQFYSGNFFDGTVAGHGGRLVRMGDFIALEPQAFPDTVNQPAFGSIRLDPGSIYRNIIGWTFSAQEVGG
ncbi:aldose epimerase family protein [Tsuneonella sp. HG249]